MTFVDLERVLWNQWREDVHYFLTVCCTPNGDGSMTIPASPAESRRKWIATEYDDLPKYGVRENVENDAEEVWELFKSNGVKWPQPAEAADGE